MSTKKYLVMIKKTMILFVVLIPMILNVYAQDEILPCIAFSFDDGNPNDILQYTAEDWNNMIISTLKKNSIHSVWFVAAKNMDNERGINLLKNWNKSGNLIANHTYNHRNYNQSGISCSEFISDIQRCDSLISNYSNYRKIFRFPYLKCGNTVEKRDSLRSWFDNNGYQQGWVSVDASDWYINSRLIQRLKEDSLADITDFRDYYVNHIFERALYYNSLSKEINQRQIKHILLLHFNLTSALFLDDLIGKFISEGWKIESYAKAIEDPVYLELPSAMPSEQSLIWMMAKQCGHYEKVLRYPGEDGEYEKDKMDKLGL
jgi:peptidoglycan/xylan/chitin deacetylase (PgdA/CDA1 family)